MVEGIEMLNIEIIFASILLTTLLLLVLFVYILRMENKSQIIYAFLSTVGFAFIWSLGNAIELYTLQATGEIDKIYVYLGFVGLCFLPVSVFYGGLIFARTKIRFGWFHLFLLIPPVLDCILILTNETHHLFIEFYSPSNLEIVYGKLFNLHTLVSYSYIVTGLYFLASSSIKNTGFFSGQSTLIFIGCALPLVVNILYTLKILQMSVYLSSISFSIAVILFVFAILKFSFLNVLPIALRTIIDNISDSFIVVNNDLKIIDYNKTLIDTFSEYLNITRNMFLEEAFSSNNEIDTEFQDLIKLIEKSHSTSSSISCNKHFVFEDFDKYFQIEITPIINKSKSSIGIIILLKDITQSVLDMETIKENQEILVGQERLASLGQLIGGIAHNLKTPIMSIAGGAEGIRDLAIEYKDAIGDASVDDEDHKEIAGEIIEWVNKIKPHCSYMSNIISAVKGQAIQFDTSKLLSFTIDELVNRIKILLKHEFIKYHTNMDTLVEIDKMTEVKGDVNSLVQVLDNIIINALQSYDNDIADIVFKISENDTNVIFMIEDYGKGMTQTLQKKLFNEMVTTKGKDGTGLGLFMSYSTIKGRFEGDMWFESQPGIGTTFYISIPKIDSMGTSVQV